MPSHPSRLSQSARFELPASYSEFLEERFLPAPIFIEKCLLSAFSEQGFQCLPFGYSVIFPFSFFLTLFLIYTIFFFMFPCKMPENLSETRPGIIKPCDTTAKGS